MMQRNTPGQPRRATSQESTRVPEFSLASNKSKHSNSHLDHVLQRNHKSFQTSCILAWFCNSTISDLQKSVVHVYPLFKAHCICKVSSIINDLSNPFHRIFVLLLSGRRFAASDQELPVCETVLKIPPCPLTLHWVLITPPYTPLFYTNPQLNIHGHFKPMFTLCLAWNLNGLNRNHLLCTLCQYFDCALFTTTIQHYNLKKRVKSCIYGLCLVFSVKCFMVGIFMVLLPLTPLLTITNLVVYCMVYIFRMTWRTGY